MNNIKKLIYIYVIGIIIGELLIISGKIYEGLGMYMIGILAIISIIIFANLSLEITNVLQRMILLPVLRVIGLSMPQFFKDIHIQYILIYGIMLIPMYLIMKNQQIPYREPIKILSILLYSPLSSGRVYIWYVFILTTIIIMNGQFMNIISNKMTISSEIINVIGEFMSLFLIIILSIPYLISDTKYWNEYVSNTIDICSKPLLLVFVAIVIHRIMITMNI